MVIYWLLVIVYWLFLIKIYPVVTEVNHDEIDWSRSILVVPEQELDATQVGTYRHVVHYKIRIAEESIGNVVPGVFIYLIGSWCVLLWNDIEGRIIVRVRLPI